MSDEKHAPPPDQNDATGHTREGSPTYHPGNPPANSHRPRPSASPPAKDADEARTLARTGTLGRVPGTDPYIPEPSPPTGGPD